MNTSCTTHIPNNPPPQLRTWTGWTILTRVWNSSIAGAALSPQNGFGLFRGFQTIFHPEQPPHSPLNSHLWPWQGCETVHLLDSQLSVSFLWGSPKPVQCGINWGCTATTRVRVSQNESEILRLFQKLRQFFAKCRNPTLFVAKMSLAGCEPKNMKGLCSVPTPQCI